MNISLRQLRAFLAVARQQHFRRAAEQVHLSQPAISRHISELESELGVRLFDRTTREVIPTEAGRYLHSAVERVLDELESVLAHVHSESARQHGNVRIAAAPTIAAELMPRCLAECRRDYPGLHLQLRDQSQSQVLDSVRGGEVDFGAAIGIDHSSEFDSEVIMHDPFWLVCRHDHPLAALERVPWKRLQEQAMVLLDYSSGSRRLIDQALAQRHITVQVMQQTGHTHTAFRMVEAGLGCCITPGLALPRWSELVIRPLTPVVKRSIVLIRRRQRSLAPAAQLAWDLLRIVAATHVAGSTSPRRGGTT